MKTNVCAGFSSNDFAKNSASHVPQWYSVFSVDAKVDFEDTRQDMNDDKSVEARSVCTSPRYVTRQYQYGLQTSKMFLYLSNEEAD